MNARKFFTTTNVGLLEAAQSADADTLAEIKRECELRVNKNAKSQAIDVLRYVSQLQAGELPVLPTIIPPKARPTTSVAVPGAPTADDIAALVKAHGLSVPDVLVAISTKSI